jgi:hypothetical protein
MKKILAISFCLGLAFTQIVQAADKNKNKKHSNKAAVAAHHNANVARKQNVKAQRNVRAQRSVNVQRSAKAQHHVQAQTQRNLSAQQVRNNRNYVRQENNAAAVARAQKVNRKNRNAAITNQNARLANQNARLVNQNARLANQNQRIVNRNVTVRNRNSWYEARNNFDWHHHHDRSWWHSHYPSTRFVIFGGGYYFWNNGYWYPAYGYDPAYSTYRFDEPIYGPNEYEPGRVISDVQHQLRSEGYYYGDIDGLIGPMTRDALARYQNDHGLYVTRAIDEPTLEALGLA